MTEIQLLRILQEALANVRKHAEATSVRITLRAEDQTIRATIADNGRGFDPETIGRSEFPRFGLATMRERAEAVGGALEIDAAPGQGTEVRVQVPRVREPANQPLGARARAKGD
jgi:signal transduction histidine kinase